MISSQLTTLPPLTEEIAIKSIRDLFRDKPFVVFGSGMSCALDPCFGMAALKQEISRSIVPDPKSTDEEQQWIKVMESLQNGSGLEEALDNVTNLTLLQKITCATGSFISSADREFALKIVTGEVAWPAVGFFSRLVNTLPEGDPVLHVLTTNYDTLFEHACDAVGMIYTCGFFGGLVRRMDWSTVQRSLLVPQQVYFGRRMKVNYKPRKHIRLYKVHGSLNFFVSRNILIENNAWMWDAPTFSTRLIITPGISKYQILQDHRQELLNSADEAIDGSNLFFFLGYGFNDSHLETYIKHKLITQACRGLIVTRDSNAQIEALLHQADNLWLVCKMQEDGVDGTRIFNKKYAGWLKLPTKMYWDITTFTTEILGG